MTTVRCPTCKKILPKRENVAIHICFGCVTTLQSRYNRRSSPPKTGMKISDTTATGDSSTSECRSECDNGSDSRSCNRQEVGMKPATLERLFEKKIKKSDGFYFCSLPDEYVDIFFKEQDESCDVLFSDLESEEKWRFHLGISEASAIPGCKYTFGKGWLQFVQAKGLDVNDFVVFYSVTDVKDFGQLHRQFYIEGCKPEVDDQAKISLPEERVHGCLASKCPGHDNTLRLLNLFPKGYEIDRDTLVQLCLAAGLSATVTCLNSMVLFGYLSPPWQENERSGKLWYKVTGVGVGVALGHRYMRVDLDYPNERNLLLANTDLEHVTLQHLAANNVQELERFRYLKTLWVLNGRKSHIDPIPYHFFTSLKLLRVLNLSHTDISELPNSIRYVKGLLYLDLSDTLLKNLPGSISHLQDLKILKLQNCRDLVTLPGNISKLKNLQHLDLGALCCLHSMPPGIGVLTQLCTLSSFLVGYDSRCSIAELGNLNRLHGELCLSKLENVASSEEASLAKLSNKSLLWSLTLQWSRRQRCNSGVADEIIECLRPNTNLRCLQVLGYGGSKFPSWIGDPSFTNLVSINLSKSENCQVLPSLGCLPSLESLTLDGLTGIRAIDHHFYRYNAPIDDGNEYIAFRKLQKLEFISMLSLEEWKDFGKCSFPSLLNLAMKGCPKLGTICSLSGMLSLQHLAISNCPLLLSLPEGHLPASVKELVIEDCPLLKSSCSKLDGEDWHKIEHVGSVWIDFEDISSP